MGSVDSKETIESCTVMVLMGSEDLKQSTQCFFVLQLV